MVIYQNYVKSGYAITITMHTQGLKSFTYVLVRCFILENIRQPYQNIYIDIDELQMFKDFSTKDKTTLKTKTKAMTEDKDKTTTKTKGNYKSIKKKNLAR